jgi:hypothetical protein
MQHSNITSNRTGDRIDVLTGLRFEVHTLTCTVRPTTGLFRTVEPNSPRTVYGLPLYRFDLCYIVYMVRNTIFHHDKVLPLGFLEAYGLPDAP